MTFKEQMVGWTDRIVQGDCLEIMREMPAGIVQVAISSPPYWGLRDYKIPGRVWGGSPDCLHEWESFKHAHHKGQVEQTISTQSRGVADAQCDREHQTCVKCGAWFGSHGLEPTLEMFCQHEVEILRAIRRVLRDDGVVWWNLGDSYNGNPRVAYGDQAKNSVIENNRAWMKSPVKGLKPLDLCGVPWRVALAAQADGWYLRSAIIWCLSGETFMLARVNGNLWMGVIKDLHQIVQDKTNAVEVLSMGENKTPVWVRVKDSFYNGRQKVKSVRLKSGQTVTCTDSHKLAVRMHGMQRDGNYIPRPHLKTAGELTGKDFVIAQAQIRNADLPRGGLSDWRMGMFVGFYLAEGSQANNKSGYSTLRLHCGYSDKPMLDRFERWGIPFNIIPEKHKKVLIAFLHLRHGGKEWFNAVKHYIHGTTSHNKSITNEALNVSIRFLQGLLAGFLHGDGHWDKAGQRWRVGITGHNTSIPSQLEVICRILGYEFRRERIRMVKGFGKEHPVARFSIIDFRRGGYKGNTKGKALTGGLIARRIADITDAGEQDVYDLSIEPIYTGKGNQWGVSGETKTSRRAAYNHLYFLGNGIWTHNCKGESFNPDRSGSVMPESVNGVRWERCSVKVEDSKRDPNKSNVQGDSRHNPDSAAKYIDCPGCAKCRDTHGYVLKQGSYRPTSAYELVFMLTKTADYYCDGEAGKEAHSIPNDTNRPTHKERLTHQDLTTGHRYFSDDIRRLNPSGRNLRNVWSIPGCDTDVWRINTKGFKEAHFATFTPDLVKPMIEIATPERGCCPTCGKPWVRVVKETQHEPEENYTGKAIKDYDNAGVENPSDVKRRVLQSMARESQTLGFMPGCGCYPKQASLADYDKLETTPCLVCDPFCGSGTVAVVSKKLQRNFIGIEISEVYVKMAEHRLAELGGLI